VKKRRLRRIQNEIEQAEAVSQEELLTIAWRNSVYGREVEGRNNERQQLADCYERLRGCLLVMTERQAARKLRVSRPAIQRLKRELGQIDLAAARERARLALGYKPQQPIEKEDSGNMPKKTDHAPTVKAIAGGSGDMRSNWLRDSQRPCPLEFDEARSQLAKLELVYLQKHRAYGIVVRRRKDSEICDVFLIRDDGRDEIVTALRPPSPASALLSGEMPMPDTQQHASA